MTEIPVLSLASPDFGPEMIRACEEIGFFSVVDHGIDADHFVAMRDLCRRLFDLPPAAKTRLQITCDNYRGFIPLGFFTPNRTDATGSEPDRYEGYKLHWHCPDGRAASPLYGPNRWPDELPDMEPTVLAYWAACDALAARLLAEVAGPLGVHASTLHALHEDPLTNMTLLHYPPRSASAATGIHPHKDTNVITLLHPDAVGGLEVRAADGSWIEPDAPDDALIVNTGEMLELWSGGRFPATPHRVINPSGDQRYSFPWFLVPNHAVTVQPLLPALPGFDRPPMPVGHLSAEVWRTNWPDEEPSSGHDLGTLDR